MMKKILYILSCICPLLLASAHMTAQTCNANFTVSTQITNSTCQSNGEIRVTLSGSNVADLINVQYGLTSTTPGGFSIDPRTDPVLKNIPPGSYELTVRAFCKNDADFDVVKRVTGLVVGGNYTVPVATFNAASSRKPYTTCNTGKIALNVTGGSGTFTFTITSAPAGVTLGTVTPTKSGTVYTLPGESYPAGNYSIQVEDACYSAACSFTLEAISNFPTFEYENHVGFRPDLDNTLGSCNYVKWTSTSPDLNTNPDFQRYYNDGMYEVGIAPIGQMPTNWTLWNNQTTGGLALNLSPYNASHFYSPGTYNTVDIYTRVKGCPSTSKKFSTYLPQPYFTSSISTRTCTTYGYLVSPWTDRDGLLCYPLTITVKKKSTGATVYNKTGWLYNVDRAIPINLEYNTEYTITAKDQNGTEMTAIANNNRNFTFTTNRRECDGWQMYYTPPSGTHSCLPINIRILDSSGAEKCTNVITTSAQASSYHYSCLLTYGQTYTFEATYADGYTYTTTRSQTSDIPTAYTLATYDYYDNSNYLDRSRFLISSVASGGSKYWPVGTKFTIESDAVGFTTQTYTTTSSSTGYTCNLATIPAGTYKLTVDHGCGSPIVTTYNIPGIYNYRDFDYTTETTCDGLKVTPTGVVTYKGVNQPNGTFFRLTNGPTGYDKSVKELGQSFTLSTAGTYTLGIIAANSSSQLALTTKTIEYAAPPLALDANTTSAYVCVGGSVGNISIKGINGVAPYKYELWDETNTTKVAADVTTSGTAYFPYGSANTTYNVRITDGCGNSFTQGVSVADLKTARIVYSAEPEVCNGGTISLRCITLGTTTYSWTGPLGFTSTDQNPTIANAQESMEGWYKVSVTPEYCGMAVEDSIYVSVYPPLTAGASVGNQTVCVRTQTSELRSETTGGKGTYAYQWQSSADGVTWTNIPGATQATYQPPVQLQAGSLNYRKATTDDCHTVYSAPVSVVMKSCYIPVNTPNIGARP